MAGAEKARNFYDEGYFNGTSGARGEFSLVGLEAKYVERLDFLQILLTDDERGRDLRILDVGAGSGNAARTIEEINKTVSPEKKIRMNVLSSDFSTSGIRQLDQVDQPPFVQADVYQLPIASESLDGVTAWDIIEHLENLKMDYAN